MGKRPDHLKVPDYLTPSPPVPKPEVVAEPERDPMGKNPVRYGDWEHKGIAIDF